MAVARNPTHPEIVNVTERTSKFVHASRFHFRVQRLDTPTAQVAVSAIFLFRVGVHNVPLGNMVYYRINTHSHSHLKMRSAVRAPVFLTNEALRYIGLDQHPRESSQQGCSGSRMDPLAEEHTCAWKRWTWSRSIMQCDSDNYLSPHCTLRYDAGCRAMHLCSFVQ